MPSGPVPEIVPIFTERPDPTNLSSCVGYSIPSCSMKFAEAAIPAFTSGPDTFGILSPSRRVPVG